MIWTLHQYPFAFISSPVLCQFLYLVLTVSQVFIWKSDIHFRHVKFGGLFVKVLSLCKKKEKILRERDFFYPPLSGCVLGKTTVNKLFFCNIGIILEQLTLDSLPTCLQNKGFAFLVSVGSSRRRRKRRRRMAWSVCRSGFQLRILGLAVGGRHGCPALSLKALQKKVCCL